MVPGRTKTSAKSAKQQMVTTNNNIMATKNGNNASPKTNNKTLEHTLQRPDNK